MLFMEPVGICKGEQKKEILNFVTNNLLYVKIYIIHNNVKNKYIN